MPIESASFISQLDVTNPAGGDQRTTADDHLRLVKTAVKQSFPNVSSEMSASSGELNKLVGLTQNVQAALDDLSAGYRSAIAVTSANLDAKIDNVSAKLSTVSAQLTTSSAALDAKIEAVAADLATETTNRQTTSAALDAKIEALSATLDNQIVTTSAALDTKIEALSATLDARLDAIEVRQDMALVHLDALYHIPDGVDREMPFPTTKYDTNDFVTTTSSTRLHIKTAGVYQLHAHYYCNVFQTATGFFLVQIRRTNNPSTGAYGTGMASDTKLLKGDASNLMAGSIATAPITAVAGDYFTMVVRGYLDNTASLSFQANANWLSIMRLE